MRHGSATRNLSRPQSVPVVGVLYVNEAVVVQIQPQLCSGSQGIRPCQHYPEQLIGNK